MTEQPSRRSILFGLAWGAAAAGAVFAARLVGAAVGRPPPAQRQVVSIGPVTAWPLGSRRVVDSVVVVRDERGIGAVSARCTHLGCQVTANARGFECNCHGSVFARDGRVVHGPALSPLPWFAVFLGDDGLLRVDLERPVEAAHRFAPEEDQ
jgi:cytochrome b6-f complex iron-sulfur subunit